MSGKTLRSSLTLVLSAMILAGCANYSGLDTQGQSLDAKSLKVGQSLNGVNCRPRPGRKVIGGPASAIRNSTA